MREAHFGLAFLLVATGFAQDAPAPVPPQESKFATAMRSWIESDHEDRAVLDAAVAAVLDAGEAGLHALRVELVSTKPDDRHRRIAVETMLSTTVLAALEREQKRGMRYAGQYDQLRVLQPYSGRFLMNLVLQPPAWFPSNQRSLLVPALRDLFVDPPEKAILDRLNEMARDTDFEAEDLREALALALAQWGRRELLQKQIDVFVEDAGSCRTADELHFVRRLAKLNYELREYPEAALWWSRFRDGTVALGDRVAAIDEYDAACSFALAKKSDDALTALEKCAELVAAGKVDSLIEITREMFEKDPDLDGVRQHERFAAATKTAFGEKKTEDDKAPKDGKIEAPEPPVDSKPKSGSTKQKESPQ